MYQSKFLKTKFFRHLIPLVLVAFVAAGCSDDDDPMGPDDDDDHTEAFGFAITADGTEVVRYMDATGGNPAFALTAGTTYEMEILFLDEDGSELEHEEHMEGEEEEEDELRMTIADAAILAWTGEEHEEGEEEEHEHVEFHGELEALAAGTTTIQLCILHEGHCDYESPSITVTVN